MSFVHKMHQMVVLIQAESDDEEIDVVTVDINDKPFAQNLEYNFLGESDSDEFIDVVTLSPIKRASSKALGIPNTKLNNGLKLNSDCKEEISKTNMYAGDEKQKQIRQKTVLNVSRKFNRSLSKRKKVSKTNNKVCNDKIDFVRKRHNRDSKCSHTSQGLHDKTECKINAKKLKTLDNKLILSKIVVNSNGAAEETIKKGLRKYTKISESFKFVLNRKSKRISNRKLKDGETTSSTQSSSKSKRK